MAQLLPPHSHKRNSAEHTICTFKNHFVVGLASVDNNFPIYLWCQILKQAEITINLLITSGTNPGLLVYAQIFVTFDFTTTTMAPTLTKSIAHERPSQRATWSKHGAAGWYIVPSLEHYRCYKLFVTERISEIVM